MSVSERERLLVALSLKLGADLQHLSDAVLLETDDGIRFATNMVFTLAASPANHDLPTSKLALFILDEAKQSGLKT